MKFFLKKRRECVDGHAILDNKVCITASRLRFGEETLLEDPDKGGEQSTHRPFFVLNSDI